MGLIVSLCFSLIQMALAHDLKALSEGELAQKLRQYQSILSLEATFKQTKTLRKMDVHINSEGHFKVTRPRTFLWQVTKPSPISISMDDQQVKIVTNGEPQVYKLSEIPSGSAAQSLKGLMALLNLNAPELSLHYDVFAEPSSDEQYQTTKFIPKKGDGSPFKELIMYIDKAGFVRKVEISERSGDSIRIEFGLPKVISKK
jgi:outer membrane lipoprotein-sorting protein